MSYLKNENATTCFSLLREFIKETSAQDNKKEIAGLALNQLEKITAGTGTTPDPGPDCTYRPRADG